MAEAKPGTKICDRCDSIRARPQRIQRTEVESEGNNVERLELACDLCRRCGKLVDNAIKRAIKPK
jgi:hypothetical protein